MKLGLALLYIDQALLIVAAAIGIVTTILSTAIRNDTGTALGAAITLLCLFVAAQLAKLISITREEIRSKTR